MSTDSKTLAATPKGKSTRHGGPLAALAARWAFKVAGGLEAGTLSVTLPNGDSRTFDGHLDGPVASVTIYQWRGLWRMMLGGDVGFAEGYIAEEWHTDDLTALLELAAINNESLESKVEGTFLVRAIDRVRHLMRPNTKKGSKRNISEHYDLGNGFYREWLDPTMTYSSALYDCPNDPLEVAQLRKYKRIAEQLNPGPDSHLLEIGCGWGGFATYAAREYGCKVTGITLSQEQHDFARERAFNEGLADKIDIRLQDYRDVQGTYDGIASIEMFEAVGERNWPRFFSTVAERLKPEAHAALQVITIEESRYHGYRKSADFIQRYVFPGGMLPSPSVFRSHAEGSGLAVHDTHFFGLSYAKTLAEWQDRFTEAWPLIERHGFDQTFRRIWDYYLAYCRAGFQTGGIDVGHFLLKRA